MGDEELEKNKKICFDEEGTLHGFKVRDPSASIPNYGNKTGL